ncbi:Leucine-rich repeat (LRR) protein (fragment) [uncultured Defluviicoccus sp.]|uniref:Leucine-rich repeat (LRR) protein n=1 Tax=metagenome TaxID=256318 RepID=A0A380TAZ3_9ZZZZ
MSRKTEGERIALERIAEEAEARTGSLDLGMLGLKALPEALFALKHLARLNLGRWFNDEGGRFQRSRSNIAPNAVEGSLARLKELSSLRALSLSGWRLNSLKELAALTSLQSLDCSDTTLSDLGPLAGLTSLRTLDCLVTKVSDLRPLAGLTSLQSLLCLYTQVSDLRPLAGLVNLRVLDCSRTEVSDLGPLAALTSLRTLSCSSTEVNDLGPLADLTQIRLLQLSGCRLSDFPRWLLERPSLEELILYQSEIPGVPAAVLSQSLSDNCLESLRAHVRDLDAGAVPVLDVKLLVLGNGRVGKTQLCRRLRGEAFDESEPSTHGIATTRAPLPGSGDGGAKPLQIWDFGGQDLYHGTHALFTRANAVFLLLWTPALENTDEEAVDGITFRNQPLAYWVDYVRHLGGKRSAVVVVQSRCDQVEDEAPCPVTEAELFAAFGFVRMLRYSAFTNRGRAALEEALAEAAAWLRDQEGIASIGAGRARVKEKLEALRDADAGLPPAARQYRTLSQAHFQDLCAAAGGVSSPPHLLEYLHNAGIVFYRQGLFHDQIILDQGWALDAIYAVFHRDRCYRWIRRNHGRFTRADLADWVWGEHSEGEQALFLSMMQSCGVCFVHREAAQGLEAEYIAPDLLPARAAMALELVQKWDADAETDEASFTYALLHPGLIRSIVARSGGEAGIAADYWQGGVYVYETGTGSRGIIEAERGDGWGGRIRVQTQRGRAAELLQRLCKLVEWENSIAGITPLAVAAPAGRQLEAHLRELREEAAAPAPMTFAQEPSPQPEWCVSYAWGDETPEGRDREDVVDRLCQQATAQGKSILRDKTAMGLGERISKFMRRIGGADRVFVILSDKYLTSPFCMDELAEVWRNCRQEEGEFLKHIRVYTLPCATIWSPEERLEYAIHWKQRYEKLEVKVKAHGYDILGERDSQAFRQMREFSRNVSDILATVADILQPRDFEDLVKYGFAD